MSWGGHCRGAPSQRTSSGQGGAGWRARDPRVSLGSDWCQRPRRVCGCWHQTAHVCVAIRRFAPTKRWCKHPCGFRLDSGGASQRHPDTRLRCVVHRAASLLAVGLHAAKSGGRGESARAGGGGAPTKPRHSRGRSPVFPVSRPSFSRAAPGMRLIHQYTWQLCTWIECIPAATRQT